MCLHVACGSGFSFSSFVCSLNCMMVFSSHDSPWDLTSPSDLIRSKYFPSFDRNLQVLQWHLQAIFESHLGSTYWAFPYKQLTIKRPLWEMLIAHAWDMSHPSDLCFTQQVCMLGMPVHDETSVLGALSYHLILSSLWGQDMWNLFSCLACLL